MRTIFSGLTPPPARAAVPVCDSLLVPGFECSRNLLGNRQRVRQRNRTLFGAEHPDMPINRDLDPVLERQPHRTHIPC
jgi:hypothetical protein